MYVTPAFSWPAIITVLIVIAVLLHIYDPGDGTFPYRTSAIPGGLAMVILILIVLKLFHTI